MKVSREKCLVEPKALYIFATSFQAFRGYVQVVGDAFCFCGIEFIFFLRMANALHHIICLEAEWEYRQDSNRFSLNTEPLLDWLRTFHGCETVYRHVLNKQDLQYYLKYFASHRREFKKYDIVYIACHGKHHAISLEGEDGSIDLGELSAMANGFFEDRMVHFGSCKTMANEDEAKKFKEECGAKLVSGYEINVDAMTSAIADAAFFNEMMNYQNVGVFKNDATCVFWKKYDSLLKELRFKIY